MGDQLFHAPVRRVRRSPIAFAQEDATAGVGPEPDEDHQQDALFGLAEAGAVDLSADPRTRGLTNQCPQDCRTHRQHVYVLCYGRDVLVSDSDVDGYDDEARVSHYVGWTGAKDPPMSRIATHGNRSRRHVVALFPGTMADEDRTRETRICPRCGSSLWYYRRRPGSRFEIGDEIQVGRDARYRLVDAVPSGPALRRISDDGTLGDPIDRRALPRGKVRLAWRDPDGYLACMAEWQDALAAHASADRQVTDRAPEEIRAFDRLEDALARRRASGEQIHLIRRL